MPNPKDPTNCKPEITLLMVLGGVSTIIVGGYFVAKFFVWLVEGGF